MGERRHAREWPAAARRWRRAAVAALLLAAAAAMLSCSSADDPLRVGVLLWPPYEMAFVANHLGLYDDSDIRLVEYESPAELVRAYRSGSIDAVTVTAEYFLMIRESDPDSRIVLIIDESHGGDALLAAPGIASLEALRGRDVGIEFSALGRFMLSRALERGGLGENDVTVVAVDVPDHAAAAESGTLDAVVTYEPTRSRLLEKGFTELFSSRDIPGEVMDVLVVRESVLEQNPDPVTTLVHGWLTALERYEREPETFVPLLAQRHDLSPDAFRKAMSGALLTGMARNRALLSGGGGLDTMLRGKAKVLARLEILSEPAGPAPLTDGRFLPGEPAP